MRLLKLCLLVCSLALAAQARPFMVVAYNVENLFDLDGIASYEDFQPSKYTRAHALTKLQNIARVVARFEGGKGPDVLLLCEIEVERRVTVLNVPPRFHGAERRMRRLERRRDLRRIAHVGPDAEAPQRLGRGHTPLMVSPDDRHAGSERRQELRRRQADRLLRESEIR